MRMPALFAARVSAILNPAAGTVEFPVTMTAESIGSERARIDGVNFDVSWRAAPGARVRCATGVAVMIAVLTGVAQAEMSGDDYRSESIVQSPDARRQLAEEFERERQLEALEEMQREVQLRAERERHEAVERMRPEGERLTAARCSGCHHAEVVERVRHSRIGWWLVVERMRWWHGARFETGEPARIVDYLVNVRPASRSRHTVEWALAVVVLVAPITWMILRRCWRRRRIFDSAVW